MLSEPASDTPVNWNVVVTTFDRRGTRRARWFLHQFGKVERTPFYNVFVLKVPDIDTFVESVTEALSGSVEILNDISRIVPAHVTFDFESTSSFESKAIDAVLKWSERLADRSFHVRLHRRRGDSPIKLPSLIEEKAIDEAILHRLAHLGQPGRVEFADPDFVINIETVGNQAGVSIWSREDRRKFPFLNVI
jgi:tRNA(Ser,Leu) C12 N-acetylase TAN1